MTVAKGPRSAMIARRSALYRLLVKHARSVQVAERGLAAARARRDGVIAELLVAGASEREIARAAGISGPAVHYVKERLP